MPAYFSLLLCTIFSHHVFVNCHIGSSNKLCNLGFPRTQNSFIYHGAKYIMYMSLCKPLRGLPRKYFSGLQNPDNVKIIILKKSSSSVDRFASNSGDFIYEGGDEVKFKLDSPCEEFSKSHLSYSVVINFKCSQEENEPIFKDFQQESCSFILKWRTPFACLLSHRNRTTDNCLLEVSGKIFDMTSLTHPSHYVIHGADYKVYINFCVPVNLEDCKSFGSIISGCVMYQNKTFSLENNIRQMKFLEDKSRIEGEFHMIQGVKGIIAFQCNHYTFAINPSMRYSHRLRRLTIIVDTSAVCLNDNRCDIKFAEERYSLPRDSNVLIEAANESFLLSTCGPLKSDLFWLGDGVTSGSMISETVLSLGSKRSFRFVKSGELELILTEGSFCPGTRYRASTVMTFVCSDEDTRPVFVGKSEKCVFSFRWKGSSYCPVRESTGSGCDIQDPIYGHEYRLYDDGGGGGGGGGGKEFEIFYKDMKFRLNLCGEVKKSCNSDMNASVCLLTNNKEIVLGRRSNQTYSFKQGSLVYELWGGECAPNVTSHVIVNVVCEFGASDRFDPVLNDDVSDCIFNFVWYTRKTCPAGKQLACTVKNQNGSVVDLNPLRLPSSNYQVPKDKDSYFLLNVCGPLWYGSHETCPPSSAACYVYKRKDFHVRGEVYDSLTVTDDNRVVLVYKNVNFLPLWVTVITFICDERDEGPRYIGTEDLKHSFEWKTKHACFNRTKDERTELKGVELVPKPETTTKISSSSVSEAVFTASEMSNTSSVPGEVSCITSDSHSFIDLSVLEPVYVNFSKCVRLYVDVCKKVSCLSSDHSSEIFRLSSRVNRPVVDDKGFVSITYYDDILCGDRSNTSLSFIFACDKSQGKGKPRLTNTTSCSYTFRWNTRVVCPNDVLVLDKSNHHIINKSSDEIVALESSFQNPIQIERGSESFYLDLFSSNVLGDEVPCRGNICEKKNGSWVSHGILKNFISYDYNFDTIVMEFDGGDVCKGTRRYSSKVYLNCSENGISRPKSDDWIISRDYCELILEVVTPCFESKPVYKAYVTIICLAVFGVFLVLASTSFGLYYTCRKRERRSSCSEMMLIRKERQD